TNKILIMKLRYRIESRGWYIPQYQKKDDSWEDFKLKDLGDENTQIHNIAYSLGESEKWGGHIYHFTPNKKEDKKNMSLIFKNELKVCAFLGAAKIYYSERIKEIES